MTSLRYSFATSRERQYKAPLETAQVPLFLRVTCGNGVDKWKDQTIKQQGLHITEPLSTTTDPARVSGVVLSGG